MSLNLFSERSCWFSVDEIVVTRGQTEEDVQFLTTCCLTPTRGIFPHLNTRLSFVYLAFEQGLSKQYKYFQRHHICSTLSFKDPQSYTFVPSDSGKVGNYKNKKKKKLMKSHCISTLSYNQDLGSPPQKGSAGIHVC